MTTIQIEPCETPADTTAFAAYLASEAEEELGEVEVKVVPVATGSEHRDLVNRCWDAFLAMPKAARDTWYG